MPRTKKPTPAPDLLHPEEEARLYELALRLFIRSTTINAEDLANELRTFAQYHFERGVAEGIFTAQRQQKREEVEPWDEPSVMTGTVGLHACPSCDQMKGEHIDTLGGGRFAYHCFACGASWKADVNNTTPEEITPGTV